MPAGFVKSHTPTFSIKTAGTANATVSPTTVVPIGGLLVAFILFDNAGTASKPVVSSIGKQSGETANWLFLGAARSTSTSAGAFSSGEIWAIKTTVAWSVAAYTITLDTSVTMKATQLVEFSGVEATLRSTTGSAYSTTTTAAVATTTGTTPVIGDLALGFMFQSNSASNPAGDSDTLGGAWADFAGFIGSSGGSGTTNNAGACQYKILTAAAHQTYSFGSTLTAGNGSIVAILRATIDPLVTQAGYRLYADGTETGATALANQDTAPTVDVTSGDANLGLRMRLQETTGGAVPATTDWQLQWEKNASGAWNGVSGGEMLADSYPQTNYSADRVVGTGNFFGQSQSFLGNGQKLTKAGFWLKKPGTPTSTLTANLYSHAGTFGSGGQPSGLLATSTTTVVSSTLSTSYAWVTFNFAGTQTLTSGTPYSITVESNIASDAAGIDVGADTTTPTHAGNAASRAGANWGAETYDLIFEIYTLPDPTTAVPYASPNLTDAAATTSRLTGGTGSFVAGKISEDGIVDDLGWSASNYTEVLYSITLKQADLANADTLRFRVLKDGATTGLTYTQTPTINVTKSVGPVTVNATVALTATSTLTTTGVSERAASVALTATSTLTADATVEAVGGAETPTVVAGFSANAGTGSTSPVSATLPAGIEDGDVGLFLVCFNNESSTPNDPTTQGGWTQVGSDVIAGTNIFTGALFRHDNLLASHSGQTVTSAISGGSARWACAGVVIRGADSTFDATAAPSALTGTQDTTVTYPAITPVGDDDLLVVLTGLRYVAAATTGVTADAEWTERTDTATTNATNPIFGATVATRALSGQAGVLQTGDAGSTVGDARDATWIIAYKPAGVTAPVVNATVDFTATSTLSATGTVAAPPVVAASVALTAASTLTTTGTAFHVVPASVALTATSTLTATAVREPQATVGLTATSTLTTTAVRTVPATVAFTSASTLTTAGVRAPQASVAFVGTSTLTATGVRQPQAVVSLVAGSTLTVNALRIVVPTVAMSASSTLITTGIRFGVAEATVAMTATSTLTATATTSGAPVVSAAVPLIAVSTLTATAVPIRPTSVALTAASTLTATAVRQPQASVSFTAASILTVTGVRSVPATAALTAVSTLTPTAIGVAVIQATVALTASSTLATAGVRTVPATASLSATSTLSTTGERIRPASVALSATSTLTATAVRTAIATVPMSATSTLTVGAVRARPASVVLTATSTLTATALVIGPSTAGAALVATSTLTTSGVRTQQATATLTAVSTLTATAVRIRPAVVAFTSESTLTASAVRIPQAAVSMIAGSTLTVLAVRELNAMAELTAVATLTTIAIKVRAGGGIPNVADTGSLHAKDPDGLWYPVSTVGGQ